MSHSTPYDNPTQSKKEQIKKMFNAIAQSYDLANKVLSVGIHQRWRNRLVTMLRSYKPNNILDVATGTGDLAIAFKSLKPQKVVGVDIANKMIDVARQKIKKYRLEDIVDFQVGDAENLPFPDQIFDAVTVAFGFRNFEDREKGLEEIYRVLRPGGVFFILEFSQPKNVFYKWLYSFYLGFVVPNVGGIVSSHRKAYIYLNTSIHTFLNNQEVIAQVTSKGFTNIQSIPLNGGICRIWEAQKK